MIYIIVPYRNRQSYLEIFTKYTSRLLENNKFKYKILIVEQGNDKLFNRGELLNCGLDYIKNNFKPTESDTIILSDIDCLCPQHKINHYTDLAGSNQIKHIYGYNKEYTVNGNKFMSLGTVISSDIKTFYKMNGFPNNFFGWGGEDLALNNRALHNKVNVDRSNLILAGDSENFYELPNPKSEPNKSNKKETNRKNLLLMVKEMRNKDIMRKNGLSNLKYIVISKTEKNDYVLIRVNF